MDWLITAFTLKQKSGLISEKVKVYNEGTGSAAFHSISDFRKSNAYLHLCKAVTLVYFYSDDLKVPYCIISWQLLIHSRKLEWSYLGSSGLMLYIQMTASFP